jgi:hypothetical protein
MKTLLAEQRRHDRGSVLITTVLLLAIAGITLGSMLTSQISYSRNAEATHQIDMAGYLADAGLNAAVVRLNAESVGNISYAESRKYFSQTNTLTASDWGFQTQLSTTTNWKNIVVSTGRYQGRQVQAQSEVTLGAGQRNMHALYAHALFAGNSGGSTNYTLQVGGTGTSADFVKGDAYSGKNISLSGDSRLRLPEILTDTNFDGLCGIGETWTNAYATQTFTNGLTAAAFATYSNSMAPNMSKVYNNGHYDFGEAFRDTIGNGVYDLGEPFTDVNGNGNRDTGDGFIDKNGNGRYDTGETVVDHGNGRYDTGEEWVEDSTHKISGKTVRVNGRWDKFGGYWKNGTTWTSNNTTKAWSAEAYEDVGDGVYQAEEPYEDQNGVYDAGEQYIDDRNSVYDYGTQAPGTITGMPAPGAGQKAATGGNAVIDPPDLVHMYYGTSKTSEQPLDALSRWGNDVAVTASDYTSAAITDGTRPEHIFVRNPPRSGSVSSGGKTIYGRTYTPVTNSANQRVDDYFLEDPSDTTYNTSVSADSIDGSAQTAPMYLNVRSEANSKVYYVDGNLYIHHPQVYSMRFRQPGTLITIVASGNITISDEFYYNADYAANLTPSTMNSTVANNPKDSLCLIALKNPACTNSGNIYIGDAQFGTGGSIHAMLYAENDFVDNNLNTASQPYISIFGNMTAGNQVRLNRPASGSRTRLDVTLDERIRNGELIAPGLPHPVGAQRSIIIDTAWHKVPGTWSSWSRLQ